MNANTTLLVQGDAAAREIRSAVREQVGVAMREIAAPVRDLYELLSDQRGVLTLARCADLLGVSARTVTESYVARRALPCIRLGQNSAPLFLLDEVICWLRAQDVSGREGGVNKNRYLGRYPSNGTASYPVVTQQDTGLNMWRCRVYKKFQVLPIRVIQGRFARAPV